mmetsp:Transcript_68996/g.113128  ORF Transcript_68996/g.113128 Transcript_68996/m.113128 type:complete len:216 (-) Transcript_68996:184-831(-)
MVEGSKPSIKSIVRAACASLNFSVETLACAQAIEIYLRSTGVRVGTCGKTAFSSTGKYSPGLSDSLDTACIITANCAPLKSDTRSKAALGIQSPRIGASESLAAAKAAALRSVMENSDIFRLAALPSDSRNSACVHPDWAQASRIVAILQALKRGTHCKLHSAIRSQTAGSRAPDLAKPEMMCSTSVDSSGPVVAQADAKSTRSCLSLQSNMLRP